MRSGGRLAGVATRQRNSGSNGWRLPADRWTLPAHGEREPVAPLLRGGSRSSYPPSMAMRLCATAIRASAASTGILLPDWAGRNHQAGFEDRAIE